MTKRARLLVAAAIGLVLGAAVGWLIGWLVRSDNAPFFVALGALAGLWGGLAWARVLPPVLLAAIGLLALALLAVVFTPPRADPRPRPAAHRYSITRAAGRWPDRRSGLDIIQPAESGRLSTVHDAVSRRAT